MRAFEYNSYLDNEGKPLIGRFSFYRANTEILATIYDSEGNVIDNPVLSNTIGQPEIQVFLPNEDIMIVVEKANEDNTFEFQYSFIDPYKVFDVLLESGGFPIAPTITALRNTDPNEIEAQYGFKEIVLAGYNSYGDKPSVHYKWIDNLAAADNGGNIIAGNTADYGRWSLVVDSLDNVDVRHFGVFAKRNTGDTDDTMAQQTNVAAVYTDQVGKKLYFPSIFIDSNSYYRISNATINGEFADNTYLYSVSGTSYITVGDTLPTVASGNAGTMYFTGKVLKTSMVEMIYPVVSVTNVHFNPTEKLIFDKNLVPANTVQNYSYSDITVQFTALTGKTIWTLNNCEIISDNYIQPAAHKFTGCEIKESYFVATITANNINSMTFTNCSSEPYYWTKFELYLTYMLKQGYYDIDLKGKSYSFTSNVYLYNSITLRNITVSGSYGFVLGTNNIKFYNSNVWINGNNNVWMYKVYFYDCVVQGSIDNDVYSVEAYNTIFNSKWATSGKSLYDNCQINQSLYLGPYATVRDCQVNTTCYLYPGNTQQMWFNIIDNDCQSGKFGIINRTVDSSVTDMHNIVVQKARITGNNGNSSVLLEFDKSNMNSSQGWYIYRDNVADGRSNIADISLKVINNTDGNGSQRTTGGHELWIENGSFGTDIHNVKIGDIIFTFGEETATRPMNYRISVSETQWNKLGRSNVCNAWMPATINTGTKTLSPVSGMSSNEFGASYYKNVLLKYSSFINVELNLGTNGDGADSYTYDNSYIFRFVVEEIYN